MRKIRIAIRNDRIERARLLALPGVDQAKRRPSGTPAAKPAKRKPRVRTVKTPKRPTMRGVTARLRAASAKAAKAKKR